MPRCPADQWPGPCRDLDAAGHEAWNARYRGAWAPSCEVGAFAREATDLMRVLLTLSFTLRPRLPSA